MSTMFSVPKTPVFGSFGEFTIGEGSNTLRARYLLTKIRPGNDGTWECELASQMKPWREVFNVEELSFDELLQRELDDSRVAQDLIPYLLGESGNRAKFFPPILAVIVPRQQVGSGIEAFYPARAAQGASVEHYGNLFDFERIEWGGELTPLARLNYNRQRAAFIIVDGQHRAMAVLALHRQLNDNWGDNAFASYYEHIQVTPEQVKSIELPTCIIYFPDLHDDNPQPREQGLDLNSVCREIFLVVNRSAKHVSEARELLLDDEDIAARLMRRTLSTLKNRGEEQADLARLYSIAYGDSDTEAGQKEVVTGQLEYSSAIAIHKVHSAIAFGANEGFKLKNPQDISGGRATQNKNRPAEILLGTSVEDYRILARNSGKTLPTAEVDVVVEKLGDLADTALVRLFDLFRPFQIHNDELRELRLRLSDVQADARFEQKKAYTLISEGSGVRNVFDSHFRRLSEEKYEREREGQTIPQHILNQIDFCRTVKQALGEHERDFHRRRACNFFGINRALFDSAAYREERVFLSDKAQKLFHTVSTQAFQLGYAMAIFTVVEELKRGRPDASPLLYHNRLKLVEFVTEAYLAALNTYFSPKDNTIHQTLTGYISEPRASVFDANSPGLRGLLAMSVNELNERQWRFFRYAILEIVHSPFCWHAAQKKMKQMDCKWALTWYKEAIPKLVDGLMSERAKYVEDAVEAAVRGREFESLKMQTESEARDAGKSEERLRQLVEELQHSHRTAAKQNALSHLKASLETVESTSAIIQRLRANL